MNYCYQYGSGTVQGTTVVEVNESDIVTFNMGHVRVNGREKKIYMKSLNFDYTGQQHMCILLTPYFKIKNYTEYYNISRE